MAKRKNISASQPQSPTAATFQRTANCISGYANNVRFESTVHDLTLVFGQSDLSTGTEVIKQHTAITIPWTVAKLALYYLGININFHELYNGGIPVAPNQIPPAFPEPSADTRAKDPHAVEAFNLGQKLRDEFISALPG